METLQKRIIPILLYCQAKKGDLYYYDNWKDKEGAWKKFFYSYYSGLLCRILFIMDDVQSEIFMDECNSLLDKYNWYDLQKQDWEAFCSDGAYGCEVPEALSYIEEIDNVAWKNSGFGNGRDAVCLMMEHSSWTFADVRGGAHIAEPL